MDKREQISEEMFELGKKFSQLAMDSESAKQAKTAFDLAVRAYKLVLDSEPKLVDANMVFLGGITEKVLRSDLWRQYLEFCAVEDIIPISKSELFQKMGLLDFTVKRKREGVVVNPPPKQLSRF